MTKGSPNSVFLAVIKDASCSIRETFTTLEASVVRRGCNLKAHWIIHAVGPVYNADNEEECEALLKSAYMCALTSSFF